jgi:hypothetical protein
MDLIGLDAASDFTNFGYAVGSYEDGRILVKQAGLVKSREVPDALVSVIAPVLREVTDVLIAIDAPLGWPSALSAELHNHKAGGSFTSAKDMMFHRSTDNYVQAVIGKKPLEVGADKIARAAHTALSALKCLRIMSGKSIPLAWSNDISGVAVIEVYPAGTLKARGLPDTQYKKPEQLDIRQRIADGLAGEFDGLQKYVIGPDDVFDACLCLVAAKDFLDGYTAPPFDLPLAQREGWIWVRKPSQDVTRIIRDG